MADKEEVQNVPPKTTAVLAVDIGGPIIRQKSQMTEGVAEALFTLRARFGDQIHLISQCDQRTEVLRLMWLHRHAFDIRTCIHPERNVHFCREVWEKAEICRRLGVTHFVENSIATMKFVRSVPNLYLYHPSRQECADPANAEFMRFVYDPDLHSKEESGLRPITLIHTWNAETVQLIANAPIFRHLPRMGKCIGVSRSAPPPVNS